MTNRRLELVTAVKRARVAEVMGWVGFGLLTALIVAAAMVI
jgi:hypothetical protein